MNKDELRAALEDAKVLEDLTDAVETAWEASGERLLILRNFSSRHTEEMQAEKARNDRFAFLHSWLTGEA